MQNRSGHDNNDRAASRAPAAKSRQEKKMTKAKRALRSLGISLACNLSLTLTTTALFGSGKRYNSLAKPFWFPPLWLIHAASLGTSFLMGLAGWLMWADGGFRGGSDALPLYVAQVSLGVVWDPLVLVIGSGWLGLVFCLVHLATLFALRHRFRKMNPFAGDIVKLCLVWVAFLTLITFKLAFL